MTIPGYVPSATETDPTRLARAIRNLYEQISLGVAPIDGFVAGLTLSNNGSDPNNDIDIATGAAADSTASAIMRLESSLTKRLDAAWAAGTNQGGLDSGSKANSTGYFVWLIRRTDPGVVDALFSTSASSPTMPASYTQKRMIGWVRTDASGNILRFSQYGNEFRWKAAVNDVNAAPVGTTLAVLRTLTVPNGVRVSAIVACGGVAGAGASGLWYLSSPDQNDEAVTVAQVNVGFAGAVSAQAWIQATCRTNTSAQVRTRAIVTDLQLLINTYGFIFPRELL